MKRDEVIQLLSENQAELKRLGVKSLALFGSVVRGEARTDSDVDFIVEFKDATSFDSYMTLKLFLEQILESRVDLVTRKAIKPRIQRNIEEEAIYVA